MWPCFVRLPSFLTNLDMLIRSAVRVLSAARPCEWRKEARGGAFRRARNFAESSDARSIRRLNQHCRSRRLRQDLCGVSDPLKNMPLLSLYINNKAGGLIFHRDFAAHAAKLDTNDHLRLASTFSASRSS